MFPSKQSCSMTYFVWRWSRGCCRWLEPKNELWEFMNFNIWPWNYILSERRGHAQIGLVCTKRCPVTSIVKKYIVTVLNGHTQVEKPAAMEREETCWEMLITARSVLLEGNASSGWRVVGKGFQMLVDDRTSASIEAYWLEAGNTVILPRMITTNKQVSFFCHKSGSKILSQWLVPLCCLLGNPPVSSHWWRTAAGVLMMCCSHCKAYIDKVSCWGLGLGVESRQWS